MNYAVSLIGVTDEQRETKDLDFLRRTPEYREWYAHWRAELKSLEHVASEYMGRRAFKDG